jgi:hypothetical protein
LVPGAGADGIDLFAILSSRVVLDDEDGNGLSGAMASYQWSSTDSGIMVRVSSPNLPNYRAYFQDRSRHS